MRKTLIICLCFLAAVILLTRAGIIHEEQNEPAVQTEDPTDSELERQYEQALGLIGQNRFEEAGDLLFPLTSGRGYRSSSSLWYYCKAEQAARSNNFTQARAYAGMVSTDGLPWELSERIGKRVQFMEEWGNWTRDSGSTGTANRQQKPGGSRSYSGHSGGSSSDDEYHAADYRSEEDFYDDHYDDFFDYYDAEAYWRDHQ